MRNNADLLRDCVQFLNARDEYLNDDKSVGVLVSEYKQHMKSINLEL